MRTKPIIKVLKINITNKRKIKVKEKNCKWPNGGETPSLLKILDLPPLPHVQPSSKEKDSLLLVPSPHGCPPLVYVQP
jgi:hypothetical protein